MGCLIISKNEKTVLYDCSWSLSLRVSFSYNGVIQLNRGVSEYISGTIHQIIQLIDLLHKQIAINSITNNGLKPNLMALKSIKMKKLSAILLLVMITSLGFAQKRQEVSLQFNSLTEFKDLSVSYRFGTEKSLWRATAFNFVGNRVKDTANNLTTNQINFGISFGREWRTNLTEKFQLRYGVAAAFVMSQMKEKTEINNPNGMITTTNSKTLIAYGLDLPIGVNYNLSKSFDIGLEVLPGFRIGSELDKSKIEGGPGNGENKKKISHFDYSITSSQVYLSIAYKF